MGTLHSAHKYVNAIQGGNEALKDVHRQNSSCVPANSPPVVRIIVFAEGRKTFQELFSRFFFENCIFQNTIFIRDKVFVHFYFYIEVVKISQVFFLINAIFEFVLFN